LLYFEIIFFLNNNIFRRRLARWLLPKWQNSFHRCNRRYKLWAARDDWTCRISEFTRGTQLRSLLVH